MSPVTQPEHGTLAGIVIANPSAAAVFEQRTGLLLPGPAFLGRSLCRRRHRRRRRGGRVGIDGPGSSGSGVAR